MNAALAIPSLFDARSERLAARGSALEQAMHRLGKRLSPSAVAPVSPQVAAPADQASPLSHCNQCSVHARRPAPRYLHDGPTKPAYWMTGRAALRREFRPWGPPSARLEEAATT